MKSQKKKKKWKQNIFRTQTFLNSVNVSVRQCQDVLNVSVRQYQCAIMSGSS